MPTSVLRAETKKILVKICHLIDLTIEQHDMAKEAIAKSNKELSLKVLDNNEKINTIYRVMKSDMEFLVTMKPMGKELRRTMAYLEMSKDINRLAEYAKHISKFVIKQDKISGSSKARIRAVHKPFRTMLGKLQDVIKSEDVEKALSLLEEDSFIDIATQKVRKSILSSMSSKTDKYEIEQRLFVLLVADALERAGDHIVQICGAITYIVTGRQVGEKN